MGVASFHPSLSEFNRKMPVEVMRDFDTVLLFGKLAAIDPSELTVECAADKNSFPILEKGSAVLVRCYNAQLSPILLLARVARSSGSECTVAKWELIPYQTHRKGVRYPMCPPAAAAIVDGPSPERSRPCQLLNISANGACIVTKDCYAVGQTLCLWFELPDADLYPPCSCKVVRIAPRRGGRFEYGLSFTRPCGIRQVRLSDTLRAWLHPFSSISGR